jgi:DNA primase
LDWQEVNARLHPLRFTIQSVPGRFKGRGEPLAPVLEEAIDLAIALKQVEAMLA